MISSELPEVLGMADRILVLREGRITGEFYSARRPTRTSIMRAATGQPQRGGSMSDVSGRGWRVGMDESVVPELNRTSATPRAWASSLGRLLRAREVGTRRLSWSSSADDPAKPRLRHR